MRGSPKVWLSRLKDGNESVRKRARRAFCSLTPDDHRFVPDLIEALTSRDSVYRYWAARGLSGIGPAAAEAVPALIGALNTADSDFRFWVVTALSSLGPQAHDAVPELVKLIHDPVFGVRQAVADGLVRIAPDVDAVVTVLIGRFQEDENEFVRASIVRALGLAGTTLAVEALAGALEDQDIEVRRTAAIELKVLGARAREVIEEVRKALATTRDEIVRLQLELALSRMGNNAKR